MNNEQDMTRRHFLRVAGGITAAALGLPVAARARPVPGEQYADFSDTFDHTGQPFSPRLFAGRKALIVYGGFLSCPVICPRDMGRAAEVLRELPGDAAVVFLSLDPKDSPQRVVNNITVPGAGPRRLPRGTIGLLGAPRGFDDVNSDGARESIRRMQRATASVNLAYTLDRDGTPAHPALFVVLDSNLRLREVFGPGEPPRAIAAAIRAMTGAPAPAPIPTH